MNILHPEYSHYYNEIYSKYISNNHDLNWNNLNNHIMCDICFKECTSSDKGYSCRECDLDICVECVIKINKADMKTNHNHKLEIVKFSLINKCTECKKSFSKNIIFFSCYSCHYFCCMFCFREKNESHFKIIDF